MKISHGSTCPYCKHTFIESNRLTWNLFRMCRSYVKFYRRMEVHMDLCLEQKRHQIFMEELQNFQNELDILFNDALEKIKNKGVDDVL